MHPLLEDKAGRLVVNPTQINTFPAHLQTDVELVYLFEGSAVLMVDGHEQPMQAGDLCICFPGVVHSYVSSQNARAMMVIFQPSLAPDFPVLLRHSYPLEPVLQRSRLPKDVALCMEQMLLEREGSFDPCVLRGYIQVVLARTLPLLTLVNRAPEISDIVYSILKYLSAHYREPVRLEDVARALGVSKAHLSRCFSERIGVNFRTYINTLRANQAKMLLRSTTENVMSIALECGFESQRTFNRVFAEIYGMPPSEYRKKG